MAQGTTQATHSARTTGPGPHQSSPHRCPAAAQRGVPAENGVHEPTHHTKPRAGDLEDTEDQHALLVENEVLVSVHLSVWTRQKSPCHRSVSLHSRVSFWGGGSVSKRENVSEIQNAPTVLLFGAACLPGCGLVSLLVQEVVWLFINLDPPQQVEATQGTLCPGLGLAGSQHQPSTPAFKILPRIVLHL